MVSTLKGFSYHEWQCKTNFSFLVGASHPHEIIQTAAALGYKSLCVNDFDGVYGLARAHNDLKHLKERDPNVTLKLNYGAEIHLENDYEKPPLQQITLILNVFSWTGYKNLNRILTRSHKDSKTESYVSLQDLCLADLEDVFVIIPMRGAFQYFLQNKKELDLLKQKLGSRLYLSITKSFSKFSDRWIPKVYELSKEFEVEKIISQDVFFHHRSQKNFHDLLTAIKRNKTVNESLEFYLPNGERSLHSGQALFQTYKNFEGFDQCLRNMELLNERAGFSLSELRYQYPKEMIPSGHTAQSWLEKVTWDGAREIYKTQNLSAQVVETIAKELDLIEDLKFADYFLTVWDVVAWARSQGILCQGRGSAANSSVCFALGVTSCDPTLFDLLFERFVSKERGDPPDIDIDFEHERREEVIQYIYKRYGRAKAAMVANVITFRTKGALRSVGKAFGLSESSLKLASDEAKSLIHRGEGLDKVMSSLKQHQGHKMKTPKDFPWHLWNSFSQRLLGFPRHLGLHSGGFIISQHPICDLVAQEPASMEGRTVIQWAKDDIEELGFFKIDCLALGMLTALRKAFDLVSECYGKSLSMYEIPQDDGPTYAMIQRAKTEGTFQIESRAQMSMLPRLKPKSFYDLVIEIAIIRPGPIQGKVIHPYLKRRDGLEPVIYPHPSAKPILSKTLGVIIFQEQLMRLAIALGDFTAGEADALRKQIGAWNSKGFDRNINPYLEKLLSGMKKKGISQEFIDQALEHMKGFAHYGFPESHSISFAFIAYASCYLKCHYPAAFYTSVLNSQPMGFYSPHALLQAASRDGVKVLPISVNRSTWDHQLELLPEKEGRPVQYAIRMGFRLISGLSKKAVAEVERARGAVSGEFLDFNHFIQSTKIFRDDYTALASANAFSCFGLDRFDALWKAEAVPFKSFVDVEERKLNWKKLNSFEKAQLDFQTMGTSLQMHPAQQMRERFWPYSQSVRKIILSKNLEARKPGPTVTVFGLLLVRQAPPSAKGMVFYTLEDETGFLNLALAPDTYRKYYSLLEGAGFLCVTGRLQKAGNYHSILVQSVHEEDRSTVTNLRKDPRSQQRIGEKGVLKYRPRNFR